jgi:hypothetical protein
VWCVVCGVWWGPDDRRRGRVVAAAGGAERRAEAEGWRIGWCSVELEEASRENWLWAKVPLTVARAGHCQVGD